MKLDHKTNDVTFEAKERRILADAVSILRLASPFIHPGSLHAEVTQIGLDPAGFSADKIASLVLAVDRSVLPIPPAEAEESNE